MGGKEKGRQQLEVQHKHLNEIILDTLTKEWEKRALKRVKQKSSQSILLQDVLKSTKNSEAIWYEVGTDKYKSKPIKPTEGLNSKTSKPRFNYQILMIQSEKKTSV